MLIHWTRFKTKREAKKRAKAEIATQQERETYFQSGKAREAEQERQRSEREDLEELGSPGPSAIHPALRGQRSEAPPPYIKDAPSYDEHYGHMTAAAFEAAKPELSTRRPEETEKQRKKRMRDEFFRSAGYAPLSRLRG